MGTRITGVTISMPLFRFLSRGSIFLTAEAAKKCLRESGIDPAGIGMLINTGVYRHKNTGEPAIAAIIQKKIGANAGTSFAFDLNNGGCGWLTAIQIADVRIQTGEIGHGMVVTGDSDPFPGFSEKFHFAPAASAIILSHSDDPGGFSLFRTCSFPEYREEFISKTHYGHLKWKLGKRNILTIRQKETYAGNCAEVAAGSLTEFLHEAGIPADQIDLVISSQSPDGFLSEMKTRTGLNDKFVEIPKNGTLELHTAGPAFALKTAMDDNRFQSARNVLFLTVGSGISVTFALYRNPA